MSAVLNPPEATAQPEAMNLQAVFARAQQACRERHCWSPFPELPAKYPNSAAAQAKA